MMRKNGNIPKRFSRKVITLTSNFSQFKEGKNTPLPKASIECKIFLKIFQ